MTCLVLFLPRVSLSSLATGTATPRGSLTHRMLAGWPAAASGASLLASLLLTGGPSTHTRLGRVAMAATGVDQASSTLSHDEIRRYSRHLILDNFGMDGQCALKSTSMLLIGSGGLGSPALMYLAAAGVGTIGCVDDDVVDESNLQRQIVHSTQSVGTPKVDSAAARVEGINPCINMRKHQMRLTAENALELIAQYDIVVDGSDNFPTRYLVRAKRANTRTAVHTHTH